MAAPTLPGVSCPKCGYSLRGLKGADVVCPECGTALDVVELIRHRPMDRLDNPVYRRVARPAIMLACGLALFTVMVLIVGGYRPDSTWMNVLAVAVLVTWMAPLAVVLASMDRQLIWLMALLHIVYLGIAILVLGGVVGFILSVIGFAQSMAVNDAAGAVRRAAGALVSAAVALGSFWPLRQLDRYVGRRCLAHLLMHDRHSY